MNPGRLRHRVAFQEQVNTQDAVTGEVVRTWSTVSLDSDTTLSSVPAECLTGPGREFKGSGSPQAETDLRVVVRWFPGLIPAWRLVWNSKPYNITSIEMDSTGQREYRLTCKGGVGDGGN